MNDEIFHINVSRHDIFDYVVSNSTYDPVEKCIDATIYETYVDHIFNIRDQEYVPQDRDYISFYKELFKLRAKASDMQTSEILRLCEEIEEISPKTIKL
jgi:hypothetical protein|tara:strand:- start:286 stop:582 length:297 start_codon:yes stop_codon:yes gene_type:complete